MNFGLQVREETGDL